MIWYQSHRYLHKNSIPTFARDPRYSGWKPLHQGSHTPVHLQKPPVPCRVLWSGGNVVLHGHKPWCIHTSTHPDRGDQTWASRFLLQFELHDHRNQTGNSQSVEDQTGS